MAIVSAFSDEDGAAGGGSKAKVPWPAEISTLVCPPPSLAPSLLPRI